MPKTTKVVNPDWLTRQQAAQLLQITTRTLDRWIAQGLILARKPTSGTVRISAASIDKMLPGTC